MSPRFSKNEGKAASKRLIATAALLLWRMRWNGGIAPWLRVAGRIAMGALLVVGISQQWAVARTNINPDPRSFRHAASLDSAKWLASHEGIVMAQQSAILHRLLGRRVADFPITKDVRAIAGAAARESVRYLVVNDPAPYEYFFPTEEERMQVLEEAYPKAFQLVHAGPGYRIFEVSLPIR